jgi:hypothetical protein
MPRRLIVGATRRDDKVPLFFSNGRASAAGRAARIAPEAAADFLIEAVMRYHASPLASSFEYARLAGERSARLRLVPLLEALAQRGLPARGR